MLLLNVFKSLLLGCLKHCIAATFARAPSKKRPCKLNGTHMVNKGLFKKKNLQSIYL